MSANQLKTKLNWAQVINLILFLIIVIVARFITNNLHYISFALIIFIMYLGGFNRVKRALSDAFYSQDQNNLQNINRQIILIFIGGLIFNAALLILVLFR